MRRIYFILFVVVLFCGACSEEKIHKYIGKDYIKFAENYNKNYSFVYAGSSVVRDTIFLRVSTVGKVCDYTRYYQVKQAILYGWKYEYENGELVDSAFVEKKNQAIPGVHYLAFDTPELQSHYKIDAGEIEGNFPVVVLRDKSLKNIDFNLAIELVDTEDFIIDGLYQAGITLSDNLTAPSNWIDLVVVLGVYGKVKHQLLIDVTGKPWDADFIKTLTFEMQTFYKFKASKELNRINEERAAQGLCELREDENDPNSAITFY